jgi:hypothetical protein
MVSVHELAVAECARCAACGINCRNLIAAQLPGWGEEGEEGDGRGTMYRLL